MNARATSAGMTHVRRGLLGVVVLMAGALLAPGAAADGSIATATVVAVDQSFDGADNTGIGINGCCLYTRRRPSLPGSQATSSV